VFPNTYGYCLRINCPCEIVYKPQDPLDCGAALWIETFSQVNVRMSNPNKKPENVSEMKSNKKLIGEHSLIFNAV